MPLWAMKTYNSLDEYREAESERLQQPRWVTPALLVVLLFIAAWVLASDFHTLHEAWQHVAEALGLAAQQ